MKKYLSILIFAFLHFSVFAESESFKLLYGKDPFEIALKGVKTQNPYDMKDGMSLVHDYVTGNSSVHDEKSIVFFLQGKGQAGIQEDRIATETELKDIIAALMKSVKSYWDKQNASVADKLVADVLNFQDNISQKLKEHYSLLGLLIYFIDEIYSDPLRYLEDQKEYDKSAGKDKVIDGLKTTCLNKFYDRYTYIHKIVNESQAKSFLKNMYWYISEMMEPFVNQDLNPILPKNDKMVESYQEALKKAFPGSTDTDNRAGYIKDLKSLNEVHQYFKMYFDNLSKEKADTSVEGDNDVLTWFQYTKAADALGFATEGRRSYKDLMKYHPADVVTAQDVIDQARVNKQHIRVNTMPLSKVTNDSKDKHTWILNYSDDTVVPYALLKFLQTAKKSKYSKKQIFDGVVQIFKDKQQEWTGKNYHGFGGHFKDALKDLQNNIDPEKNKRVKDAPGNGALMYMWLVGYIFYDQPDFAAEIAAELAKITHGGAQASCAALARAIALMMGKSLMSDDEKWRNFTLKLDSPDTTIKEMVKEAYKYDPNAAIALKRASNLHRIFPVLMLDQLRGWGSGAYTLAAATYIFSNFYQSPMEALSMATHNPGDSDSIASIVMAMLLAYHTPKNIKLPKDYFKKIRPLN